MKEGIVYTGVPSREELKAAPGVPSQERMARGAVAVVECVQNIPCNPCEAACPFHAISVGEEITSLPCLDEGKCTGCGSCIAACPGLAIFVVNKSHRPGKAWVEFPYEYLPMPAVGQQVPAVNRAGQVVGTGTVLAVRRPKQYQNTSVIRLEVDLELADEVRGMKRTFREE